LGFEREHIPPKLSQTEVLPTGVTIFVRCRSLGLADQTVAVESAESLV
jgi:hypothetical protein